MTTPTMGPIAVVGYGAIMPMAPSADAFWANITGGRYCITDVPADRWSKAAYHDPDRGARDKTYSTIGGWVTEFDWNPIGWRMPIPPAVSAHMDIGQQWAVSIAREALLMAGYPDLGVDPDRVAVIIGNALGGEAHNDSTARIRLHESLQWLERSTTMATLPPQVQAEILRETREGYLATIPEITEDSMPGELANIMAGRVAALFNFRGLNYTTDAACASGLAALSSAVDGLNNHHYDAVVTGGVDRNMGVEAFVKFCKIGALSDTGTRPFDAEADGFVMGEGGALFVLKRLADAEAAGNTIYAVITGVGGSSDGKGKGITAPNPVGQKLAVRRAWERSGSDPATVTLVEAHGTSTRVGDAAELATLTDVFGSAGARPKSVALGSVKSNIGHLKGAAGAAGMFKMIRALHDKVLPPSLNFVTPNPNVDWEHTPFAVNTTLREWVPGPDGVRRGAVSAFGFGGTNFHVVLEEYIPGRHRPEPTVLAAASTNGTSAGTPVVASVGTPGSAAGGPAAPVTASAVPRKAPLRGALVLGGPDDASVIAQLRDVLTAAQAGQAPAPAAPDPSLAAAGVRIAIDYGDAVELASKAEKLLKAFASGIPAAFRLLRQQGIFVGRGPAPKVAFLYTGQGSQYVNMLQNLEAREPIVQEVFRAADKVMEPLLGRPLTSYIFIDGDDPAAVKELTKQLMQTEITQPAVLAADLALTKMLDAFGVRPDLVMGHSLGEYGALVAAGALDFPHALEAVSARGREMTKVSMSDNGAMAAVFGPLAEIEATVATAEGYVVVANINSYSQAVVGGTTEAVEAILKTFEGKGINATRIPVSHAFHTSIVEPATVPFVDTLRRLNLRPPVLPIVANVTGEFYPADATVETMLDYTGRQISSPVQFVKGLQTLYAAGARVFVEVGPKKALHGFVEDVLGGTHDDVLALYTNHPKLTDEVALNQALCGLYASGLALQDLPAAAPDLPSAVPPAPQGPAMVSSAPPAGSAGAPLPVGAAGAAGAVGVSDATIAHLGRLFAGVLEEGLSVYRADVGAGVLAPAPALAAAGAGAPTADEPVVVTGAAMGLPGRPRMFEDDNVAQILAGQQFITPTSAEAQLALSRMRITRLIKDAGGGGSFQTIDDPADVIKLAGQYAPPDIVAQYGVDKGLDEALDDTTRMAMAAGFDAMRDAGIPLVMRYKTTTIGSQLQDRWGLPVSMRDDTGVIFASAFPGQERMIEAIDDYAVDRTRRENLLAMEGLRTRLPAGAAAAPEVDALIAELRAQIDAANYQFDRRFLFRVLSMGHSQFAELIGARGPNTQINAACASTTQAINLAEDWIRAGRCRRVIVVAADATTGPNLMPWVTAGFLATGAAATDARVEDAATPFDARRHGMIVGAGAAGLVVETAESARERGIRPIAEVLAAVTANSAFHGTRLDIEHIQGVMETLLRQAEARGIDRHEIAPATVFVSHETYTPARGGSASAEIKALRSTFGSQADRIVITNTKGLTGHAMGAGIEDVVAVKALETGIVPPVANYLVPDPELGELNLSKGGSYPVQYALRLAAGFGSQIAMTLMRYLPLPDGVRRAPTQLGFEYRVIDPAAWQRWLDANSGHAGSRLEIDHRRLRIVDVGAPVTPVTPVTQVPVPYAGRLGVLPAAPAAPAPVAQAPVTQTAVAPTFVAPVAAPVASVAAPAAPVAPAAPAAAPAPAAPAPSAPAPAAPAAEPAGDPILATVTALVAEMTGYPSDLLDPDLDLEADLGVDTVKQAEVFAAVRAEFDIPRDENLRLREFPTLNHVAGWVRSQSPAAAAASAAAAAPAPVSGTTATATLSTGGAIDAPAATVAAVAGADEILATVTGIVAEMTGYPTDLLDPDLDLEADLGVDTVKQAEVFAAVRGQYDMPRDESLKLREFPTLRHVAGWVRDKLGMPEASAVPAVVSTGGTIAGTAVAGAPVVEAGLAPAPHPGAAGHAAEGLGAPAQVAPTAVTASTDEVLATVTQIVADMTGYPNDLLDPDLDLEADLGVDTVKQAEVFAAVRGQYDLPRDENLKLREFPTLRHVAGWVKDKLGLPEPAPAGEASATLSTGGSIDAPPAASSVDAVAGGDEILATVTAIVAGMTGYPNDLLDPDLDLEADLGVDTVKQAEVFAAVRGQYDLPRDENLKLREFPTLRHVAGWVKDKLGSGAPAGDPEAPAAGDADAPGEGTARPAPVTVAGNLDAVDALPRRIPTVALRPAAADCLETGIVLAGSRVVVMHDEGGVGKALVKRLAKADVTVLELPAGIGADDLSAQLDAWRGDAPINGVYWLAALDDEGDLTAYDAGQWTEALRRRVKSLYATMRRLYDDDPFLVSATRLGGYHGYDEGGAISVLGGAVTGFTKAYRKEKPGVLVKAVDLAPSRQTAGVADILLEETLRDPGAVEIGRPDSGRGVAAGTGRCGVAFVETPFPLRSGDETAGALLGAGGTPLTSDSVVLVSGAAGSIVCAITADLAKASGGTFHLLDLTPTPDRDDPDLAVYRTDPASLKATIAARIKSSGGKATPVAIEKELAGIERRAAALTAIEAVEAAGGTAHYYSVDLTDAEAVAAVMAQVAERTPRIDILLHAAGLEISRTLPSKEPREYDLVFDVKSNGWFSLWRAASALEVGTVVVFSSVAGRFGNQGQTDYSAANDLMCKAMSNLRRSRPQTRGLALDWTAWGGIGMATRGSIPAIMAAAGVQMLPPEAGVAWIRREVTSSAYSGEVIVAGTLGAMAAEYHESGGVDPAVLLGDGPHGPMIGTVGLSVHDGVVSEVTLDPKEQGFLFDHRIDGTAVLPGVMGLESFAEVASLLAPAGYQVRSVEDVEFLAPVKFYRDEPRTLRIAAVVSPVTGSGGTELVARCRLTAQRSLPGQDAPVTTTHFTGTVRLAAKAAGKVSSKLDLSVPERTMNRDQVYEFYFHGPAYQVMDVGWRLGGGSASRLTDPLPDNHVPADRPLLLAPRLIELCFQTTGLWEAWTQARMALPMRVGQVAVLLDPAKAKAPLVAHATPGDPESGGTYDADVVDASGRVVVQLRGYGTVPLPVALSESVTSSLRTTFEQ